MIKYKTVDEATIIAPGARPTATLQIDNILVNEAGEFVAALDDGSHAFASRVLGQLDPETTRAVLAALRAAVHAQHPLKPESESP